MPQLLKLGWQAFAVASSLLLALSLSRAGELQIDVLRPIYKNGMVVSCSMTLSAALQSLAHHAEADQRATFKVIMLSRESSCSSSEYDFPLLTGGKLSVTFKRVAAQERSGLMSDLLVVVPHDPRLRKACAEINKIEAAVCLSEAVRK